MSRFNLQIANRCWPARHDCAKGLPIHTKFCIADRNDRFQARRVPGQRTAGFTRVSGGGSARGGISARPSPAWARAGRLEAHEYRRPRVREIRIRDAAGAFRVLYVAKFDDAVYVLHCFQKKTQKTSKADLNLAAQRYRDLLKELDQ